MKASSSKSMPSPGRPRVAVPQISLSSSLSGRLKANASIKGGHASPMFPPGGKKRGCAPEEHEPSSPKVTCIGHVRVKTKQGKKPDANHHYHHSGEVSFRRVEVGTTGLPRSGRQDSNLMSSQQQMSSGVEACRKFRMFGVEWSCFQPCRSSCSEKGRVGGGGGEIKEESDGGGSCGAVIARWLVALHEGPDGKGGGRKIELVVGKEEHGNERNGSYRRQVFEGIEFDEKGIRGFEGKEAEEEERGRVSVCIPPKNALLLMRCRSDPVKMAALVGRFCSDPVQKADVNDDGKEDLENISRIRDLEVIRGCHDDKVLREQLIGFNDCGGNAVQGAAHCATIEEDDEEEAEVNLLANELHDLISSNIEEETVMEGVSGEAGVSSFAVLDREKRDPSRRDDAGNSVEEKDGENETSYGCVLSVHFLGDSEDRRELTDAEAEGLHSSEAKVGSESEESSKDMTWLGSDLDRRGKLEPETKAEAPKLPECLLLMMREPKLSMEVSKETWVCSNDFLRWLPQRPVASRIPPKVDTRDDSKKVTDPNHRSATSAATITTAPALTAQQERILQQPPRNSCSFQCKTSDDGTSESVASLVEQKLGSVKVIEPFILTRCKSEPMRAEMKLPPDGTCFWKNRRLEPHHRPVNNLVKAAGLGY
ncbi:hypothetical protein MLD38_034171 [Melastoma candidum]|uniref:Uncharacterized protein n=1 Tax=Melastoma candidum TaxID=119954 RepID=A0ACB9M932_9MYRT|nr:hypothetical protein MLD38_034171 [Melastoma candidum]